MRPRVVVAWRDVAEAAHEPLAPAEAALLSPSALPKRRAEFTAGRAAARAAVAQMTGLAASEIVILREAGEHDGRPYAARSDGTRLPIELSITHADGVALAAAADVPLGVDVVAYERLPDAFVDEAFAPGELDAWRGGGGRDEVTAICTAFAAKEAVLKWLGCGMRVPLRSVVVTPAGAATDAGPFQRIPVRVRADGLVEERLLSACLAEHDRRIWMLLLAEPRDPQGWPVAGARR
jgi:4'-phosphopantetheinyl transferase